MALPQPPLTIPLWLAGTPLAGRHACQLTIWRQQPCLLPAARSYPDPTAASFIAEFMLLSRSTLLASLEISNPSLATALNLLTDGTGGTKDQWLLLKGYIASLLPTWAELVYNQWMANGGAQTLAALEAAAAAAEAAATTVTPEKLIIAELTPATLSTIFTAMTAAMAPQLTPLVTEELEAGGADPSSAGFAALVEAGVAQLVLEQWTDCGPMQVGAERMARGLLPCPWVPTQPSTKAPHSARRRRGRMPWPFAALPPCTPTHAHPHLPFSTSSQALPACAPSPSQPPALTSLLTLLSTPPTPQPSPPLLPSRRAVDRPCQPLPACGCLRLPIRPGALRRHHQQLRGPRVRLPPHPPDAGGCQRGLGHPLHSRQGLPFCCDRRVQQHVREGGQGWGWQLGHACVPGSHAVIRAGTGAMPPPGGKPLGLGSLQCCGC